MNHQTIEDELSSEGNLGRKIHMLRKIHGVKQETIASALGISRQAVSKLEQSEFIDEDKLKIIAKVMGISVEALKNFNEDATINYIQHNYDGSNKEASNILVSNNNCTLNPMEKVMELVEENKKLYEKLIQAEREKNEILQRLLDNK